ncbi:hypothetical protein [uncultured Winogradskyella sp.]|uniref:hypothetical protein n=1 Tax=uncultured Winogradskyella sp. TaxID=395353 RepID=UPI003511AD7A
MNYKFNFNFFFVVIALVVGAALFNQIDFKNLSVANPLLSIVYTLVFITCIALMFKSKK